MYRWHRYSRSILHWQGFDHIEILPPVDSGDYIVCLQQLIRRHEINVLIPTSEAELRFFALNSPDFFSWGVTCILPNAKALTVGFDKYQTYKHLVSYGFPAPWTAPVSELRSGPQNLPCILKSREGCGSSSVITVNSRELCTAYASLYSDYIWQELIPSTLGEFTCGLYRCVDKTSRCVIFKRRLNGGLTGYGEVVRNKVIEETCLALADSLDLYGSINVQLRLLNKSTPMIFEINPRFSSTVRMRDSIGFQDLIWSIQEQYLGEKPGDFKEVDQVSIKFARRLEEYRL